MAQSVKHLTLDFGSGHDLTVREFVPHLGSDHMEPAWDSLSLALSAPPLLSLSLSLKINNFFNPKKISKVIVANFSPRSTIYPIQFLLLYTLSTSKVQPLLIFPRHVHACVCVCVCV